MPVVKEYALEQPRIRAVVKHLRSEAPRTPFATARCRGGPRRGSDHGRWCDDPRQIDELTRLVSAEWSRRGRLALHARWPRSAVPYSGSPVQGRRALPYWFARVGSSRRTNSFKAYSRDFVQNVGIDIETASRSVSS